MINEVLNNDFRYHGVDVDYDSITSCHTSGCDEEGICRCGVIENAHITSINIDEMVENVVRNSLLPGKGGFTINSDYPAFVENNPILVYGVKKIFTLFRCYEKGLYDIEVEGGYYGQEIGEIKFSNGEELKKALNMYIHLKTDSMRVEFILDLEYGKVLPELVDLDWAVKDYPLDMVKYNPDNYEKTLNHNLAYLDLESKLPNGIIVRTENKLTDDNAPSFVKLVDGYHRLARAKLAFESDKTLISKSKKKVKAPDSIQCLVGFKR